MTLDDILNLPDTPSRGRLPYTEYLSGQRTRVAYEDGEHLITVTISKGWESPTFIRYRWVKGWLGAGWHYEAWSESLEGPKARIAREREWEEKVG